MPHLLTSPSISSEKTGYLSAAPAAGAQPVIKKSSSGDSSQPRKDFRPVGCYDEEKSHVTMMISPEQEKQESNFVAEQGRDDRELAAMQTMLELPNMPNTSPASYSGSTKGGNSMNNNAYHPYRASEAPPSPENSCYKPHPRSFVPYLSTRGRGSCTAVPHYASSRPQPHNSTGVAPQAPPYSPHQVVRGGGGDVLHSSPHSPFVTGQQQQQRRGHHVSSQRGGAHSSGIVYTSSRGQRHTGSSTPSYNSYYEHREYYPRQRPYHAYLPDAAEPRRIALATDMQDELETEHHEKTLHLASCHDDSVMEEATTATPTGKGKEEAFLKKSMDNRHNVRERVLVLPKDHHHPHPYSPHPHFFAYRHAPPPYSRYPMHPHMLHHDQHLRPRVSPFSRHLPPVTRGHHHSPAHHDQGYTSTTTTATTTQSVCEGSVLSSSTDQCTSRSRSNINNNNVIRTKSDTSLPSIVLSTPSLEKCIPMKGLIPSKFWGDINKLKDAYIPVFDQLVNFPDYLPKHQPSKPTSTSTANGGISASYRHCVMCGIQGVCTAASTLIFETTEATATNTTTGKDESSSSADGSSKLNDVGGAIIPRQNKGICTKCDVIVWVISESGLQIKWCKGCKNYRTWAAFGDKGGATKCTKCRERQKEKYAAQKSRPTGSTTTEVEPTTRKRKAIGEVSSTESSYKVKRTAHINDHKMVQTLERREDNENEEDDSNQLQW